MFTAPSPGLFFSERDSAEKAKYKDAPMSEDDINRRKMTLNDANRKAQCTKDPVVLKTLRRSKFTMRSKFTIVQ